MTGLSFQFPTDDLLAAVQQAVSAALAQQPRGWLDVDGAASYLSSSPAAVRALVKRDAIPVHRAPNGRLLFDVNELDQWVRA